MADPDWMPQQASAPSSPDWMPSTPAAVSVRSRAPATGLGMVGQTWDDLVNPNHPQHGANALEQGVMDVAFSKPVQSLKANFDQAVDSGLFMEPTRAVMEGLGINRQPGESDAALHARYNTAITNARADAQQRAQANTVGSYDGNPLHMAERVAQQVGNVGAGIVANPQYFALPGMGVGSSVATRIGTAAAGNAAIGGVSDAAAQLMDVAEGQKKDFDIQQNLQNTLAGGAFGAAMHGAVEVAPFVKSLFAGRGRDTTPGGYPLGQTSPLTPNNIVMNPAESAQYRQLLASGSVDDIKNFFKGRQGPQPSWQDVNSWVDHRDAAQQSDTVPQHVQDTVQRLLPTDQASHVQQVTNHVNAITAGWKNAPEVEVVHSPADIADPRIRAQVTAQDPTGDAVGIYGSDGKVRLFSQNIHTPDQASAALFHEGLGHYGLDQQFGDRLNQTMATLADRNVGQFGKAVDEYQKANPDASRSLAAEEVLAEASQKGQMKPSWTQAVGTAVKQFGRKMGLNLKYSDGEINHILAMSHDAVINGKSVRDNGFRGANKFMFTGKNATGFNPFDDTAFRTNAGDMRNEIADNEASLNGKKDPYSGAFIMHGDTLGEMLNHPELFHQYPELRNLPVTQNHDYSQRTSGHYDTGDDTVGKHINIVPQRNPMSTVLHEVQHAIQHIEESRPFMESARNGGTAAQGIDSESYWNHPSEVEARTTEARRYFKQVDRGLVPPVVKFMTKDQFDLGEDQDKPFTFSDVIDHYQLKDQIDDLQRRLKNLDPSGKRAAELRDELEEAQARHERLYGDVTHELDDAFESAQQGRGPGPRIPYHLPVYYKGKPSTSFDKTTNIRTPRTFPSRRDAFAWIDARQDAQQYGINRFGTDLKFMRAPPEDRKTESGNFEIIHTTGAVGEPFIHVKPTEQLMPNRTIDKAGYDNYDRGQAGVKAFRGPNGWQVLNSRLPENLRGKQLGREMYRELAKEVNEQYGEHIKSDSQVSAKAARLWEAAGGIKNPNAKVDPYDQSIIAPPGGNAYSGPTKFMRRDQINIDHTEDETDPFYQAHIRGYASDLMDFMDKHEGIVKDLQNTIQDQKVRPGDTKDIEETRSNAVWEKFKPVVEAIHKAFPYLSFEDEQKLTYSIQHPDDMALYQNDLGDKLIPPDQIKFATRAQIASTGIARKDFVPADLEGMATHISMNYDREANEQPIAITRELAFRAGIEPNDIKLLAAQHPGELAARVARIGAATDLASTRIKDILTKFDTPEWTSQHHFDLASAIADRNYLVERFKEESGAIGRALNVTKIFRSMTNGNIAAVMERLQEEGSGLAGLADPTNPNSVKFVKDLKEAFEGGNPDKAQNMMTNVNKPYWEQYLTTAHMNMMLSALSTHVKAPIDMGTGIARNVIEKVVAMPIGKVRQMFEAMTGKTVQPGVGVAELANHLQGLMDAVTTGEVYRRVLKAAATGESSYVVASKGGIGVNTPKVVLTQFANQFGAISNPRFTGLASAINKPMDLVSAQDTFFRSVEMNAQLGTIGAREAREELGPGASTKDVMARGRYWAQNPTSTMLRGAFDETNRTLLLNDNPVNRLINRARLYRPGMNPGQRIVAWFANNLAPFIRVESNSLINRVIQRSPLAVLDPTGYTQAQLRAGGAKADIALSKMIYGTVLMGMMWTAAAKGKDYLTGQGDSDISRYKEDLAAGRVPNAVHENGRYTTGGQLGMSLNPFDMHNHTAQMVTGMRQAWDAGANHGQVGTGLLLAAGSIFHDISEQSWVSDITPAFEAITARGEQGGSVVSNWAANELKTFMPNISNQIARKTDVQRDTTVSGDNVSQAQKIFGHIGNELSTAIPGLRENLPIKYSVYGNPLPTGASMTGVHTMIPGLSGNGVSETTDPAERELDRLNVILPDMKAPAGGAQLPKSLVTPVSRNITINGGTKKQLTPAEFEEYQHKAGRYIVDDMRQEMSTPEWQSMSDYDRVLTVRQIESDQKANAKEDLFGQ